MVNVVVRKIAEEPFWSSPNLYDTLERAALQTLSNRAIQLAQASHFQLVGYPIRVYSRNELWRYVDVMQERRLRETFDSLGGLTEHELKLIDLITRTVVDLTKNMGRKIVPGAALIRAIMVYRAIKHEHADGHVFEIGPGSGYVSALLLADNFYVTVTDTTQAFVLWQGQLLSRISDRCTFVSWWDWFSGYHQKPAFTCATANHMLNEMHPAALAYFLRQMTKMLKGKLYVESLGEQYAHSNEATLRMVRDSGVPIQSIGSYRATDAVITWSDMEAFWKPYGGVPVSPDEEFMSMQ